MNRFVAMSLVVSLASTLGCGDGDSLEKFTRDELAYCKQVRLILVSVQDEASAQAAAEKLKPFVERGKALKARREKLGELEEATFKAVWHKYGKDLVFEREAMTEELKRVFENTQWAKHLRKVMLDVSNTEALKTQ